MINNRLDYTETLINSIAESSTMTAIRAAFVNLFPFVIVMSFWYSALNY